MCNLVHKPLVAYTKLLATVELILITFHCILFFHVKELRTVRMATRFKLK